MILRKIKHGRTYNRQKIFTCQKLKISEHPKNPTNKQEGFFDFKGREYKVEDIARDCENPEKKLVVYKQLYESKTPVGTTWIRSLDDFIGDKEFKEDTTMGKKFFKKGEKVKRFVLIPE